MTVREKVFQAAERLSEQKPFDQITFAEVAEAAGVHWTAVRRHFGSKEAMRSWLRDKQSARDAHPADTRTRVLDAAAKVFAEHGYADASLDKAAAYAGMTKGAVYWHFSSKQDLFLAVLERHLERQLRLLPEQIEGALTWDDPASALTRLLLSQFGCLDAEQNSHMLFPEFVASSRKPEVRDKLQDLHGRFLDRVGELLAEMQRKGHLASSIDSRGMALLFDALLKGLLMEWIIDPQRCDLETVLPAISKVLWQGLSPTRRTEPTSP